jgi:hypothetical protein
MRLEAIPPAPLLQKAVKRSGVELSSVAARHRELLVFPLCKRGIEGDSLSALSHEKRIPPAPLFQRGVKRSGAELSSVAARHRELLVFPLCKRGIEGDSLSALSHEKRIPPALLFQSGERRNCVGRRQVLQ